MKTFILKLVALLILSLLISGCGSEQATEFAEDVLVDEPKTTEEIKTTWGGGQKFDDDDIQVLKLLEDYREAIGEESYQKQKASVLGHPKLQPRGKIGKKGE